MNNSSINSIAINGVAGSGSFSGGALVNQDAIGSFVINSGASSGSSSGAAPALVLARINFNLAWIIPEVSLQIGKPKITWAVNCLQLEQIEHAVAYTMEASISIDKNIVAKWRQKVTTAKENAVATITGQGLFVAPIDLSGNL